MRLIEAESLELVEYTESPAQYAILSHTWEEDEVTYQDMMLRRELATSKHGWSKIQQACSIALRHGLSLIWVDTCCIDKTNSVELTESVNSMFEWYKRASLCIAHLMDLHVTNLSWLDGSMPGDSSFRCRWWTRGWTLQELIAPHEVQFYDSDWNYVGSKEDWRNSISRRTGIPLKVLLGQTPPHMESVARIFSWAVDRLTTRIEDASYCLLGLFDVNMPLLYGEGAKAFQRLQEEIVKHDNDLTIFAHNAARGSGELFATDITAFRGSGSIIPFSTDAVDFSITNRGLRVSGDMPIRYGEIVINDTHHQTYFMFLGHDDENGMDGAICLRKIGPRLFQRDKFHPLAGFGQNELILQPDYILHSTDYYILSRSRSLMDPLCELFMTFAIYLSPNDKAIVEETVPHTLYDKIRRLFFRTGQQAHNRSDTVIAIKCLVKLGRPHGAPVQHIILCDCRETPPRPLIFNAEQHPRLTALLFADVYRENSVPWVLLEIQYPKIRELLSWTVAQRGSGRRSTVSVRMHTLSKAQSPTLTPLHALEVSVEEHT